MSEVERDTHFYVRDNDLWARSAYVPNKGDVLVVRADLSDALLREAVDALICVIPTHRFVGNFCWCHASRDTDAGHTAECMKARATLAKLRAHLDGETE